MFDTGRYDIKSHWVVVGFFWLVLSRWVDRGSAPAAAVCVLG